MGVKLQRSEIRQETHSQRNQSFARRYALSLRIKENRINQFSSVKEQDTHHKIKLRKLRKARNSFNTRLAEAKKNLEKLHEVLREVKEILGNEATVNDLRRSIGGDDSDVIDLNKKRDELQA